MTDTATEQDNAPTVQLDEFGQMALDRYIGTVNEYNGLVNVIKAASGTFDDVFEAVKNDGNIPEVEKINVQLEKHRAAILKLENDLDSVARPIAEERVAAGSKNVEEEIAKADALHKTVKAARNYLIESYGEGALNGAPDIARRTNRSTTGGGGGKRIRGFDVYVDDKLATMKDAKNVERSNFAAGAKAAGVATTDLQKAFYAAAGGEDKDTWPDRVEFTVTGEGDVSHRVVAVRLSEEQTVPQGTDASQQ